MRPLKSHFRDDNLTSDKALSVNCARLDAAGLPHRCTPPCDGRAAPWSHRRVLADIQVVGLLP
jgi:hypothetical protein